MEFDKSRVYTAVNAEELKVGSLCIFADTPNRLMELVQSSGRDCGYLERLTGIHDGDHNARFKAGLTFPYYYSLAYLVEPPKEWDVSSYKPFKNVQELKEKARKYDSFVAEKNGVSGGRLLGESFDGSIVIQDLGIPHEHTFEQLFEKFVFPDGSPIGSPI